MKARSMRKSLIALMALGSLSATALTAGAAEAASCSPNISILKSPRRGSHEVQAKALNDRGDVVGFSDGRDGTDHAILWKRGRRPVDLGVPRGWVSSEAYAVNNHRVVFGLLYDKRGRTFPFRWKKGRTTVLRDPHGRVRPIDMPDSNAINNRGQIAATLLTGGNQRAVRWSRKGKATFLPPLPGHAWSLAWGINGRGVVSGWSRRVPRHNGENNPVTWSASGKVVALKAAPGRADGSATATNRSGLSVGYLGNLGTDADPESDQAAVWITPDADPLRFGPTGPLAYGELVDVNDLGQAVGMHGTFTRGGFTMAEPAIWRVGWPSLRTLRVPRVSRRANPVVIAQVHDVNARGAIVGNVYGLSARDYSKLRRVDPVVWRCAFG
jgi:probable HAF family extracellular repeat protein